MSHHTFCAQSAHPTTSHIILLRGNTVFNSCFYLSSAEEDKEEPKTIGLAMIPGHHIVSIEIDCDQTKRVDDVL